MWTSISKEKSQDDIGRNPTPRRYADGVKKARGNKFDRKIPRLNDFGSTSRQYPSSKYQSTFFFFYILVNNLGIWKRIVGHTTRKNIMVPISLLEVDFPEEIMHPNP